jgi:hypothetical protein
MSSAILESQNTNVRSIRLPFSTAEEVHDGLESAVKVLIEAAV